MLKRQSYSDKLRDPRWQRRRLEVFEAAGWKCERCGDKGSTLHAHHKFYMKDWEPWEYAREALLALCEACHHEEHELRECIGLVAACANVSTDQLLGYVYGCALNGGTVTQLTFKSTPRFEYLIGLGDVYGVEAERLVDLLQRTGMTRLTDAELTEFARHHDVSAFKGD